MEIINILYTFKIASGLKINYNKSNLFPLGIYGTFIESTFYKTRNYYVE